MIAPRTTATRVGANIEGAPAEVASSRWLNVAVAAAGCAWVIVVLAQLTGNAGALHHHALIEGGPPLWVAIPLFLIAWFVMVMAMMLPASLPAVRVVARTSAAAGRGGFAMVVFLAGYAAVWTVFGLAAFLGDVVLHHIVDATPWLGRQPLLIETSVLIVAGTYQFTPLKRRGLGACRHPADASHALGLRVPGAVRFGYRHAVDCVASSWALMLLMFAAGFANLWWMVALAAVMAYEAIGRQGQRVAPLVGILLLGLAGVVVVTGVVPGFGLV
jgi:predicted metal-binding membrane protein